MANKTQFQTNNNELSELIEVLQGKAAGGSVETCEVSIGYESSLYSTPSFVAYTTVNNEGNCVSAYATSFSVPLICVVNTPMTLVFDKSIAVLNVNIFVNGETNSSSVLYRSNYGVVAKITKGTTRIDVTHIGGGGS